MKLKVMAKVAKHYTNCDRPIDAEMMKFKLVGEIFELQSEAALLLSKKDDLPVPSLKQMKVFTKWWEAMVLYFSNKFGVRNIPLSWIIREDALPPNPLPALAPGKPHTPGNSIVDDAVLMYSHDNPLFDMDNTTVFSTVEQATRGTQQAATVKPHGRKMDGRAAVTALLTTHLGDDKWDDIIQESESIITGQWNGTGNTTLQRFIDNLKAAYVELETAAQHVNYQVPDERTRVTSLLKSIEKCDNSNISASRALITQPGSALREDFDQSCLTLLPSCPVAAKAKNKKTTVTISAVGGSLEQKVTSSGLEVRWYNDDEWWKFDDSQRAEIMRLRPDRETSETPKKKVTFKKKGSQKKWLNKNIDRTVSSAMKKQAKEQEKKRKKAQKATDDNLQQIAGIISALRPNEDSKASSAKKDGEDSAMAAAIRINKIISKSS